MPLPHFTGPTYYCSICFLTQGMGCKCQEINNNWEMVGVWKSDVQGTQDMLRKRKQYLRKLKLQRINEQI